MSGPVRANRPRFTRGAVAPKDAMLVGIKGLSDPRTEMERAVVAACHSEIGSDYLDMVEVIRWEMVTRDRSSIEARVESEMSKITGGDIEDRLSIAKRRVAAELECSYDEEIISRLEGTEIATLFVEEVNKMWNRPAGVVRPKGRKLPTYKALAARLLKRVK